jgi:hypothetical protein
VAAPAYAIAIRRAAEILGEDKELLWDMATDMEPEHRCLSICDTDDQHTVAFTPRRDGITCARWYQNTNVTEDPRGLERMVTNDPQAGSSGDVSDDVVQLQIHLGQRLRAFCICWICVSVRRSFQLPTFSRGL